MAKIFLDTNYLLDLTERDTKKGEQLSGHKVFVSPLSYHVLFHTYRYKVPKREISKQKNELYIVDLTENILGDSLIGPTGDLEDNIQLHSAAKAECNYFLTGDKQLLKMKFFGRVKILNTIA